MFLYYRCTNDVVIVHKMAAPGDVRMRLRTHIQRAIVAACELEVTYKYSVQILGIVCVSIDGDEENELVVKIQKKWCKGTSLQGLGEYSVGSGVNAVHASCDSQRMTRCCEPTVNGASDKINCDTPELTDSFPRSFRPIPFSETSSQRNPMASVSGVNQGAVDCPKSYPLCPYDLPCDSHEMFQQRPGTVPLDNKAMNTCADVPVVCDVRPLRRVCKYKPISPPHLGSASSATSTDIHAQHFTGFTRLCGDAVQCDATLQKRLLFAPNDGQPPGGSGHRSALSRKLFALTSFTDATLRGTSCGGRNGMGKVRKRTPVGGRWIKLPERPGQRTMAQCFGITKNKRLTYSAEEQVELEHGGFARTMQRLLCRPPLRALTKDGFESDVNAPTYQAAGSVNDGGPDDITGGDSVMENVHDINKVSLNQELDLLVKDCHRTTAYGKLISGECRLTVCDDVDNATSAGPPRDPVCISTPMVGASTLSALHRVTCVNNVSEYCTVADHAKTDKTSDFQDGRPRKKTTGTSDHVLVGSASEVIRDKHSGNVSNTNNTVSSEAKAACSVSGRRVVSVAKKVDFGVVNDDHHVMSMSDSSSDTEESVKGHETKCDVATTAVPVTGYSQEPNMSSDIGMDSSVNLCEQRNVGVTETASGHVGPASTASQCGGCTTTSELANNYTLRKTAKCCTVTDTKDVMSTSGGTTNGIACTSEEQTVEACQTKGEVSSEIRQLVPVRDGDNVYIESVHHKLKDDDSAACLRDTDDDESIIVCSHATDEGHPAEVCKNIVTSVGALMTDCGKNTGMVMVESARHGPELCGKKHVISNGQCPDPSVDSCDVSVSSVALGTHVSADGSYPRKRDTRAMSAMLHEHNLTPGKHVRNLFPESIACKDVAGHRDTYHLATNGLFFSSNLPAVETPDPHAGRLSGNERVTTLGHAASFSSVGTDTELPLERVNENQIASVPCGVASVEMSAIGEDSSNTRLGQPDEDGLVQRPSSHDEHSPQRCGVEVTRLTRLNTLFHSVSGSAGVNGAFLVSPLIRPPIRVRHDGSSRIPEDESRVCSLLMTAPASVTEHGVLPDQASVHQPDGLLMRERQVHSELGRFVLKDLTSPDRDVVHLGYTLSGGQTKTKSADPDCCNSDVTGAAVPTQKEVGSAAFHMRDDDIGVSQLETVLCRPTDSSDTSPTHSVPHQHTSSCDTTETLLHVTNMNSASGVRCPDVARDRVNVTGSWTVVTDPLVTFPTSSVAAASRPLVPVTSFRNIHFSNVMFGSTEGKTVVSEAGFSPCAVKENRGDGLLQKLRRPLTPKTRDERWKWPASLLRTISRRSRAVSRRRLKTKSETVYSVDKVKGKGRWSRRWRPGAESP